MSDARIIASVNIFMIWVKYFELMRLTQTSAVIVSVMFAMLLRLVAFFCIIGVFVAMWSSFSYIGDGRADWTSPYSSTIAALAFSLGDVDYEGVTSEQGYVATWVLIIFVFIVVLLLNNFVIAFMGDAYE